MPDDLVAQVQSTFDRIRSRSAAAAAKVRELVSRPLPTPDTLGDPEAFDPWDLFPAVYGSYNSEFDQLAIEVLCDLRDGTYKRTDLAAKIFREMLCTGDFCDYGSSPRVCFPTPDFREVLPALIERWRAYAEAFWGHSVTAAK